MPPPPKPQSLVTLHGCTMHRSDCMDVLRTFQDRQFDLAIVDTPYGIGESGKTNKSRSKIAQAKDYKSFSGDDESAPEVEYFRELERVSQNQIIFGANHFIDRIGKPSPCWIVWDKLNGESDFADCELAYTSFKTSVRRFAFRWAGMLQGNMKEKEIRIHPTQKPVALYRWILEKYSAPGQSILDTHCGSASSVIACHQFGCSVYAIEKDQHYFTLAVERVRLAQQQGLLL